MAYIAEKGLQAGAEAGGIGRPIPISARQSFGKMPGFRDGDFAISDPPPSSPIWRPSIRPLRCSPTDPESRHGPIWYEEFAEHHPDRLHGKRCSSTEWSRRAFWGGRGLAAADAAEKEELPPLIDYIESVMPASGHLVEDQLTLADLAVASPFVNMGHVGVTVDAGRHPKTAAFVESILGRRHSPHGRGGESVLRPLGPGLARNPWFRGGSRPLPSHQCR